MADLTHSDADLPRILARTFAGEAAPDNFSALAELDQTAFDALPIAICLCAPDGSLIRFNRPAAELWGRAPRIGEARYCGSWRLYRTDGSPLPHHQSPSGVALRTGEPVVGQELELEQPGGRRLFVLVDANPLKGADGLVRGVVASLRDITARSDAEARQRQLIEELNHRVKNTLATVHALASNTARNAASVDEFKSRFEARLVALSQAHTLLGERDWRGVKVLDLIRQQLEPCVGRDSARVTLDGPDIELQAQLAVSLSMMFHELTTNAAKYGPLSVAGGRIAVAWELDAVTGDERTLTLRWAEAGGPPVVRPRRTGFGTRLIKSIADGLNGRADLLFEPSGVRLTVSIPFAARAGGAVQ